MESYLFHIISTLTTQLLSSLCDAVVSPKRRLYQGKKYKLFMQIKSAATALLFSFLIH